MSTEARTRLDVAFPSSGDECRAWLFLPDTERPPLVILGHGLGGTREYGLEPYAQRFADAGIAALVFTYRHFGDSGGHPRQLLDIERQLDDWAAALTYARTLEEIDSRRIALWGTSFAGGHVLVAAARDQVGGRGKGRVSDLGGVAAVVSQCPFTDGLAAARAADPRSLAYATVLGLRDQMASLRGKPPVMVPLVGPTGSAALMTSPDSEPGYRALIPEGSEFDNGVAARFLLHVGLHRPGRSARKINAPILFCICDTDAVAPADTALHYAATAPRGEVKRYPVGHFDIYRGEPFENAVRDQTEFLVRHLGPEQPTTANSEGEVRRTMKTINHRRGQPRSLANQVVAITGGARGIGLATATALARHGARVAIGDLDGDLAGQVAAELGGDAFGVGVDVTDNAAFTAFLDGVEHRLGPLDVLVNNAGIMNAGPIEVETEAMTARAVAINLEAVIHGTREAVLRMKPRRAGHIVNVSSAVSKVAGSHCATYVATKFGVAGFSEAVAIELRGTGVEMSVIRPSLCNTELTSGFAGLRGMPLIDPEDVAERIVETLQRPRFDVPVPKSLGPMLWLNQALPFRARVALAHLTKADDILSHIDAGQRAEYAARLERIAAAAPEPGAALASVHATGKD